MKPRPYQTDAVNAIIDGFNTYQRQLAILPTGAGKTCIFSWIAQKLLPARTLILAHREELIDQAIDKLHQATGIVAEKEKAEFHASLDSKVVVASVQSMIRRLDKWPADHFGLVIADEAHHSISKSWRQVLDHFNGNTLGVTATADRGDKRNLGEYYENIACEVSMFDLIHAGFLSNITCKSIPLSMDISGVKSTAGDLDSRGLSDAITPYLELVAEALTVHAPHRKILAFLPLIDTSKKFVDACVAKGINACHIDGKSTYRREILTAFEDDEYQLLSNAMLLTEGYDCPDVDCIVVLRPTRSRPLYSQMIGRGTRVSDFKSNLLILDFLWHHERHNLIHPAHLIADTQEQADLMQTAMERAGREKQDELDLEDLASEASVQREKKLADELQKNKERKASEKNMMEFCLSVHRSDVADYEPTMKWEEGAITEKQAAMLTKNGIDPAGVRGAGHASKLIDLIILRSKMNLASPKQVKMLKRFKHPNPAKASFDEASNFLTRRFQKRPVRTRKVRV